MELEPCRWMRQTGVSILSVRLRQSVPNFCYEEINSHHLPDAYRASWKRRSELGGGYPKP